MWNPLEKWIQLFSYKWICGSPKYHCRIPTPKFYKLQNKNSGILKLYFKHPDKNDINIQEFPELLFFLVVLEVQFLPKNQIQIKFKILNYKSISRNSLLKHYEMKIHYQSAQSAFSFSTVNQKQHRIEKSGIKHLKDLGVGSVKSLSPISLQENQE